MVKVKKFISEKKYLAAKDMQDMNGKKFTIDAVVQETVNDVEKLCLRFAGVEKKLVLNQTNLTILSAAFGDDTDMWINKQVTIRIVKTKFNGDLVDSAQVEV